MLSALEYKYAHDFRGLVAYKAFSSDYIAVPLLDRESPYVSHCARARLYHGKRAILDLERTGGEKFAYMDTYRWIFRSLRHRTGTSRKRKENFDSSIHRFRFFLSLSLSSLAEARVERYSRSRWPSILSIHHRCIGATIGCRSANTSFGKSYRFSSTVCRSARSPSARLHGALSLLSLASFSRYPPVRKILDLVYRFRNEKDRRKFK